MTPRDELLGAFSDVVPKVFKPTAYYDVDGDCIEFFASSDEFRAERLDEWVTVYRSERTNEVCGSQIKQVKRLLSDNPGLDIEIHDGEVCLAHFLRARAWRQGDPVVLRAYKVLISKADGVMIEKPKAA